MHYVTVKWICLKHLLTLDRCEQEPLSAGHQCNGDRMFVLVLRFPSGPFGPSEHVSVDIYLYIFSCRLSVKLLSPFFPPVQPHQHLPPPPYLPSVCLGYSEDFALLQIMVNVCLDPLAIHFHTPPVVSVKHRLHIYIRAWSHKYNITYTHTYTDTCANAMNTQY